MPCVYDRDGSHAKRSKGANNSTPVALPPTRKDQDSYADASEAQDYLFSAANDDESDPPEGRTRRMLEARLMHQYLTETGNLLAIDEITKELFAVNIPDYSFSSDALLYSMYTLAALHLQWLGKDVGFSLEGVATKYFSMALREHKKEIANLNRETVDPVCLTSCLIRCYASVQLQGRPLRPYTPPWEWLTLIKTSATVFHEAWRLVGIDQNSVAFRLIDKTQHIHNEERRIGRSGSRRRLEHLMRRDVSDGAASEPWDGATQVAYESTLEYIGRVLDLKEQGVRSTEICRMLVMFPMMAEMRFIDLVRERAPRALVILAHYFALYANHNNFWFIGDAGSKEVRALAEELTGEWRELMDWPLKMVGK